MGLELLAVILTLLCAYYTVKGNKICWLYGIASTSIYLYLLFMQHLYGQVFADTIILIQCFYGLYYWNATEDENLTLLQIPRTIRDVLAILLITPILAFLVHKYTNNPQPQLDILTTLLALLANWYLAKKYVNGYIIWILADFLFIAMFINQHMYWSAGLYIILIGFSINGIIIWIRNTKMA